MAGARGDVGAATGDLQGTVTATDALQDVGGIHGGARKLATAVAAVDVEKEVAGSASTLPELKDDDSVGNKRKLTLTGFDPYDLEYSDDEEYEYDSGEDVYNGNVASFNAKEVEKIRAKGVASFYNRKIKKWHCPYCTTKPKPKDGRFDHLVSHAEDVAIRGEDYKIRVQHATLTKALTPV
ncbi:hypothetical protein VPH35_053254 [Triticum aestivum]